MADTSRDYSVVYRSGEILLHRADCAYARWAAATGFPVLTMMDCASEPGALTPKAACLCGGVCKTENSKEM